MSEVRIIQINTEKERAEKELVDAFDEETSEVDEPVEEPVKKSRKRK